MLGRVKDWQICFFFVVDFISLKLLKEPKFEMNVKYLIKVETDHLRPH